MTGPILHTHHDDIPNFAHEPTIFSVREGVWSDPATWGSRVPGLTDIVSITHHVWLNSLDADVETIGISHGGSLRFLIETDTRLRVANLLVMHDGILEIGAPLHAIQAQHTAEIIIKDRKPDTAIDPHQYGTGIIVVDGTIVMHGAEKVPFFRVAGELQSGEIVGGLAPDWEPDDLLVLPDTRETRTAPPQWEVVKSGQRIAYNHLGARNLAGALVKLPHVANLTRNIIIRSENPAGTRGHVLLAGNATADIRYVTFKDMGRTTAAPLDSTLMDVQGNIVKIGKNQIGRYPLHLHHILDGRDVNIEGVVIDGSPKWGVATHDTHYSKVRKCVTYNCVGAGYVWEDGSETGNVVEDNIAMRCDGHGDGINEREDTLGIGVDTAYLGDGFWGRGQRNILRRNVAVGCARAGFHAFERMGHVGKTFSKMVPMHPGSDTHDALQSQLFDIRQTVPFAFESHEAYACGRGYEFWYCWISMMKDCVSWHQSVEHVFYQYHGTAIMDGFIAIGDKRVAVGIKGQHGTCLIMRRADVQKMADPLLLAPNKKGLLFEDVSFDGIDGPWPPNNKLTMLSLSPAPESTLTGIATLTVTGATAGIVKLSVDGKKALEDKAAPYTFKVDTTKLADGPHMVVAMLEPDAAFVTARYFVGN